MDKFVALLASGVAYGAILALVALGFVVLYKATGVMNFAQGDLVTFGAYLAIWATTTLSLPSVLGYVVAIVLMFAVGILIERVAYTPLRTRPPLVIVIATLAAAVMIEGIIAVWQGSDPKVLRSPVGASTWQVAGAHISMQRVVIVVVTAIAVFLLVQLFKRTSFGRQLRALAVDPDTAQLYGVRVRVISMVAFGLSGALAALAGVLVAPLGNVDPVFGFNLMISAFAAAVLGGFGSIGGVVIGALVIGLVQQLLGGYVFTTYSDTLPFILMFAVIVIRPGGLVELKTRRV